MNTSDISAALNAKVARMKQAHLADGPASAELRRDRLQRAAELLITHHDELADAISADYGHRSPYQSLLADVLSSVAALRYASEHLETWMQPDEQDAPGPGMQARVQYQPLGVVGISLAPGISRSTWRSALWRASFQQAIVRCLSPRS